jgi:hypothetical protein
LQGLVARLQAVREGFATLPVDDRLEPTEPPPPPPLPIDLAGTTAAR